ncbi:MAG: NADH-quinone oxidoreductase subunit N [Arcicella sp.]|nr:NADH-quinone oxidoreductase subunit N [Arcicella sp.]
MTNFLNLPEQLSQIPQNLGLLLPELLLSTSFLGLILIDLVLHQDLKKKYQIVKDASQANHFLMILSVIIILITINFTVEQFYDTNDTFLFGRMMILDSKAITFKFLILITAIFVLGHLYVTKKDFVGEFYPLLISMVLGLCLMTMSVNLLMIYLSIEIVSIASYILTAIEKNKKGLESGLKYILFGATSSAVMLYGMSLLYGMTGTLNITSPDFSRGLSQVDIVASTVAIVLTISGFMFKLSAAPFHVWTPDVYESAPTPVVAFFSVAPKIAGFLVAIRFYSAIPDQLQNITAVLALASITFGNFSALWQTNAKRMLAYSTIAHTGFILIGLVSMSQLGMNAIVFYLVIMLFTNLAAFLLIDFAEIKTAKITQSPNHQITDFKGLGRINPFYGIMMLIVMISLAGLPPTAGFLAKLNIFTALWESYQATNQSIMLWLFIFGLMNTAVSLFFYLKIPFMMFFKEPLENQEFELNSKQYFLAIILVLPILILFFKADWLMDLVSYL